MSADIGPEDMEPVVKRGCWDDDKDSVLELSEIAGGVKMETISSSKSISVIDNGIDTLPAAQDDKISHASNDSTEQDDFEGSPSPLLATPHSGITLTLDNADLWNKFSVVSTEMIITKSGRRMFPTFSVSVYGLQADQKYNMTFRCTPADNKRYKFVNTNWVVAGKAESHIDELLSHLHPDSPAFGKHWLHNKVHFKKVKLTNNKNSKKGQIALNSMHKYIPCVIVSKFINKKKSEIVHVQEFHEAYFYAVTAYQNDQVTQLKIDNNPFAKAFRDSPTDQDIASGYQQSNWFNAQGNRWNPPISPLFGTSSYPPASPLFSPKWSPTCISPLLGPYHGDFTQGKTDMLI
jgi:hypothetical protein